MTFPPRWLVPGWLRDIARHKTAQQDFEASIESERAAMPHCDEDILHAPGECEYCDEYPDWQNSRILNKIAFTSHPVGENGAELPCPADVARPNNAHQNWPGNRPKGYQVP